MMRIDEFSTGDDFADGELSATEQVRFITLGFDLAFGPAGRLGVVPDDVFSISISQDIYTAGITQDAYSILVEDL